MSCTFSAKSNFTYRLTRVFILIDSRRGVQRIDEEVMDILDNKGSCAYQIILTKVDLLRQNEVAKLKIGVWTMLTFVTIL